MKLYKKLLVVALAAMPAAALQAQTYNDTVRTNTWTLYGAGGVSGYHGFRGGSDTGVRQTIAPDFSVGVKYNIKPWVRVGLNLGYTEIKARNNGFAHTQTVTNNFQIGDRTDGVLTTDKVILSNRNDIHLAGADLNADFNILELFQKRNQRWNLWIGTGAGYLHGWNRSTLTTAVSEEGISKGDDHFNVYNHDYITTESANTHINTLYIPARLSLEYDITPCWTVGVKGEYKYMPLDVDLTPKGIWSANVSIAYNFGGKRARKPAVEDCHAVVARLNEEIATLKANEDANEAEIARLKGEVAEQAERLAREKAAREAAEKAAAEEAARKAEQLKQLAMIADIQGGATFKSCSAEPIFNKGALETLGNLKEYLAQNPEKNVYLTGHTDNTGSAELNMRYGQKRADAYKAALVKYGIPADRVFTESKGMTQPIADNATEEGRAKNRRVDMEIR